MPRSERLRLSKQFLAILRRGTWARSTGLSVGSLPNGLPMNRSGIRIRKSVGDAVARNQAKRRLREAYRHVAPSLAPGHDILLILSRTHGLSLFELEQDVRHAFSTIGLLT